MGKRTRRSLQKNSMNYQRNVGKLFLLSMTRLSGHGKFVSLFLYIFSVLIQIKLFLNSRNWKRHEELFFCSTLYHWLSLSSCYCSFVSRNCFSKFKGSNYVNHICKFEADSFLTQKDQSLFVVLRLLVCNDLLTFRKPEIAEKKPSQNHPWRTFSADLLTGSQIEELLAGLGIALVVVHAISPSLGFAGDDTYRFGTALVECKSRSGFVCPKRKCL